MTNSPEKESVPQHLDKETSADCCFIAVWRERLLTAAFVLGQTVTLALTHVFITVIIINKYHPHQLDHHHYELDCGKWLSHISLRGTVMKWKMIYTEGPKTWKRQGAPFDDTLNSHIRSLAVNKQKPPPLFVPWGAPLITKLSHYEKLQIIRWPFFATKLPQFNTYCLPVFRIGLIAFLVVYVWETSNIKNRITKTLLLESYHNIIFRKYNDWKRSYIVFVFATNE